MANAAPTTLPSPAGLARTGSGWTERWSDLAVGVLELLDEAVLVVDGDGRVRGMNGAARRLLAQKGGLSLGPEGLHNGSASVSRELGLRIRAASRGTCQAAPLRIDRDGRPPLSVRVASLETSRGRRAAVFATEAAARLEPPSLDQIIDRFGTTPMESKVAQRLARGLRVEAIANDLGIAVQTVRGHLKQAFAKTGAHRQAELVALLLSPPRPWDG